MGSDILIQALFTEGPLKEAIVLHSKSTLAKRLRGKGAGIPGCWLRRLHLDFYLAGYNAGYPWDFPHEPRPKKPYPWAVGWDQGFRHGLYMQGFNVGYLGTPAQGAQQMTLSVTLPAPLADEWQDGYRQGCGLAQWEDAWATPD